MPFDDHELGADGAPWGVFGGDARSSALKKPVVASIKPQSLSAFRAEQPDPAHVPVYEPYDINRLGEHPPLPAGFVAPVSRTPQPEVPDGFNPYAIWNPK